MLATLFLAKIGQKQESHTCAAGLAQPEAQLCQLHWAADLALRLLQDRAACRRQQHRNSQALPQRADQRPGGPAGGWQGGASSESGAQLLRDSGGGAGFAGPPGGVGGAPAQAVPAMAAPLPPQQQHQGEAVQWCTWLDSLPGEPPMTPLGFGPDELACVADDGVAAEVRAMQAALRASFEVCV
jgi:hypothetical protein